jgi:hypothetical protein
MLPVFTIIFFGIMFIKNSVVTAQVNLGVARDCAWAYSNSGCTDDAYLAARGCKKDPPEGSDQPGFDGFDHTPDRLFSTGRKTGRATTGSLGTCKKGGGSQDGQANEACSQITQATSMSSNNDSKEGGELLGALGGVLGFIADIFENERHTLYAPTEIARPAILGGRRVRVSSAFRISCNSVPQTIGDFLGGLLDAINPF